MKKLLTKINENPYWLFILAVPTAWDLINSVRAAILTNANAFTVLKQFDWFGFLFQVITVVLLFVVWKAFISLRKQVKETEEETEKLRTHTEEKMLVFSHVVHLRGKRLFVRSYSNFQLFRLPNETDDQAWARLPEGGLFRDHWFEEFTIVRKDLTNAMKNKSVNEINALLRPYYPKEFLETPIT